MRPALLPISAAVTLVLHAGSAAASISSINRDMVDAPDPAPAVKGEGESGRTLIINGNEIGQGTLLEFHGGLYVGVALAALANLRCGRTIERDGHSLCAIPASSIKISNMRLEAIVPPGAFLPYSLGATAAVRAIPELTPGKLGFLNYNVGASKVGDGVSFSGVFDAGLRLEENAFDLSGVVARAADPYVASSLSGGIDNTDLLDFRDGLMTAVLTQAAYRRNWFDRRLSLAIGRTALQPRGLLGGNIFDGIGLSKDNLDNLGDIRTVRSRNISGYTPLPGVLTYRIGNTVLKQVPIQAGAYSIDPALFAGLPGGGKIEIVGVDGRVTGLDLPMLQTRSVALYKAGTYDFSLQAGRIRSASGSYVASLYGGSRYGITDGLTVEGAGIFDPHSVTLDGAVDWLLPKNFGVAGVDAAFQTRQRNRSIAVADQTKTGWTLTAYYEKDIGTARFSVDYLRNHGGGVIAGGYTGYTGSNAISSTSSNLVAGGLYGLSAEALFGSTIGEDIRVQASMRLFKTGITGTLRLISTSYAGQPDRTRFAEIQLSGGLGRFGNWGTYLHDGRNGNGQDEFSANVYWQKSLGRRTLATLSYETSQVGGARVEPDRYAVSLSGTTDTRWDQGSTYQVTVDQEGRGSVSYDRQFAAMDVSASIYRDAQQGVTGQVNARGSLVFADGHLTPGQTLSDAVVVVKAPQLRDADVFIGHNTLPRTRTDSAGYAVLSHLQQYKPNYALVSDKDAPLGLEVPDEILSGTVHPFRGYIVTVATHMAHPARLFLSLPVDPKATQVWADVNGEQIPVEADGSLYLNDLSKQKQAISLSWLGAGKTGCIIPLSSLPAISGGDVKAVRQVKGVICQ